MERLKKHDEFVGVLRLRHRVTSADIVAHYSFARRSSEHSASKEQADSAITDRQDPPSVRDGGNCSGCDDYDNRLAYRSNGNRNTCRLGLTVANSVGHAVVRNKIKRRFRVLGRRYESHLPENCDVILRAKRSAATADFASLDRQVMHLFDDIARKADQQAARQAAQRQTAHQYPAQRAVSQVAKGGQQ